MCPERKDSETWEKNCLELGHKGSYTTFSWFQSETWVISTYKPIILQIVSNSILYHFAVLLKSISSLHTHCSTENSTFSVFIIMRKILILRHLVKVSAIIYWHPVLGTFSILLSRYSRQISETSFIRHSSCNHLQIFMVLRIVFDLANMIGSQWVIMSLNNIFGVISSHIRFKIRKA